MALGRKLFVNWHTKRRQKSDTAATGDGQDRIIFHKYETVPLEIVIVEPRPSGSTNQFDRIDITDLTLRVAINETADTATPKAEQTTWTKNTSTNTFSG